ncbi:RluA family pseudouridine synthase [bacterium]|nr:RluA family pseudouridine synthase [bacterium]
MPARRDFPIGDDYAGGRLETFLRRKLGLPRTLALKALRKGWVRLAGHRAKADARLESGTVVTVTNPALALPGLEERASAPALPPALVARARASVRFRDADLAVSAKPAGEVVHAGTAHATGWIDALRAALAKDSPVEEVVPIGRLDRDTSGLLLVALRRAASRKLFEFLRENRVSRTYSALVLGRVSEERGEIDAPLAKVEEDDGREQVRVLESGKPALTRFEVTKRLREATLLRVTIETGRTQQIRAHLASIGHPVLGDPRHGGAGGAASEIARRAGLRRLFLHAGELDFPHPEDASPRHHEEPLPEELSRAMERLSS